jgi:1-acyl-sn-glycerol-3-phosphate acyltransferase
MKGLSEMYIFSFYFFWIGYTYLLSYIFGINTTDFNSIWTYFLILGFISISLVASFFTQLIIMWVLGKIRQNTDTMNAYNHKYVNSTLKLAQHLLRLKVIPSGLENIPEGKFVFVGNHQENFDIIALKPIFKNHPICFIGKESLFKVPFIGPWMYLIGNVPIGKYADRSAAESIINGIKNYKKGHSIGIFPEGKRSLQKEMIDFKPGAFKLAMKPKADILIGTLYNLDDIFDTFPFKRHKAYIHFSPILKYEDYKELNSIELAAKVKAIIQKQLDEFKKTRKS